MPVLITTPFTVTWFPGVSGTLVDCTGTLGGKTAAHGYIPVKTISIIASPLHLDLSGVFLSIPTLPSEV
jgi:hypothetical protein